MDMKRTVYTPELTFKPELILCADIHLREDTPVCRVDNFQESQWKKLDYISELQKKYNCPVICSGDLFHHWKPSPWLIAKTIEHLPSNFHTVYGNHDLPNHSYELKDKSGIYALEKAGKLTVINGGHRGQEPIPFTIKGKSIAVWHKMAYQTEPYVGAKGGNALELINKYPQFDLIVTGDNHQSFVQEYNGRILVNPGSMMRQTSSQINHIPLVYLWNPSGVLPSFLPIKLGVITREHIEVKEDKETRLNAFISILNNEFESNVSFEDNIRMIIEQKKISKSIETIIYKSIEL